MSKLFFTFKWGKSQFITEEQLRKILQKYYTKEEVDALLKKYATIEDVAGELANKLDTVEFEQFKEHLQSELDEKAEQTWVEQEVQRLEDEIANIDVPTLDNYYTKEQVDEKIEEIPKPNLSNLAKLNEDNTFTNQVNTIRYDWDSDAGRTAKPLVLQSELGGEWKNKIEFGVVSPNMKFTDSLQSLNYMDLSLTEYPFSANHVLMEVRSYEYRNDKTNRYRFVASVEDALASSANENQKNQIVLNLGDSDKRYALKSEAGSRKLKTGSVRESYYVSVKQNQTTTKIITITLDDVEYSGYSRHYGMNINSIQVYNSQTWAPYKCDITVSNMNVQGSGSPSKLSYQFDIIITNKDSVDISNAQLNFTWMWLDK